MATYKGTAQRPHGKRVATNDGRGWTTVPDGISTADIELEIDVVSLIEWLGVKAIGNRSHRARAIGGLIIARARNVRRTP